MTQRRFVSFTGDARSPWWQAASSIRWDVFVAEQQVPRAIEIDRRDFLSSTIHLLCLSGEAGLATCRILPEAGQPSGARHFHLGRVAVRRETRGQGLGSEIILAAITRIAEEIPRGEQGEIILDAQVQALDFYRKCGFAATARATFLDAGILHQEMSRVVDGVSSELL